MAVKGWRGMLAPLDVSTGDGRRFLSEGVTNRQLPLPMKWQRADAEGHDDSVVIGSCLQINYGTVQEAIDNGWIDAKCVEPNKYPASLLAAWGAGEIFTVDPKEMPRLAEDVAEALLLTGKQVIGPSVDAGSAQASIARKGSDQPLTDAEIEVIWEDDSEDVELEMLFTSFEIAAATLVSIPAFAECRPFEIVDDITPLTAAVRRTGWDELPLADRDMEWDGTAAEKRIADQAGIGSDNPDWESYAGAFLYQADDTDPETKQAYGFQIVDLVDDLRRIVPRAVFAVAAVLQGARGGTTIPQADQDAMKSVVTSLYERMADEFEDDTIVVPWVDETASLIASLTASAPVYDHEMFADPKLARITPITITDDGEVYGHVATHDTCHVGFPGECVTAPTSHRGYSDFHRYALPTGNDQTIEVGRITTGFGNFACTCKRCRGRNDDHACLQLGASGAISHHDRMGTVAWVRAGEDTRNNAIWVHGVLNPDASVEAIASLAKARVSGDWRPIGGRSELVEVLSLTKERAGFPLPSFRMAGGKVHVLTAAGTIHPVEETTGVDYGRIMQIVSDLLDAKLSTTVETAPEVVEPTEQVTDDPIIDPDLVDSLQIELMTDLTNAQSSVADILRTQIERMD